MSRKTTTATEKPATNAPAPAETTATAGNGKSIYLIEGTAPPYIAGRRVGHMTEIELTEPEARAELLSGHIWPKDQPRPAAAQTPAVDEA